MTPKQQLVARVGAGVAALVLACVPIYEGTVLKTYHDPVGIETACTGHTGPDVKAGQVYTQQQCDDLLAQDLFEHDADIAKCVDVEKLTTGQRAAFLSFAFNVGAPKFCKSTMAGLIRAGQALKACAELSKWVYAGQRDLPGLVRRRSAERAMCEGRAL